MPTMNAPVWVRLGLATAALSAVATGCTNPDLSRPLADATATLTAIETDYGPRLNAAAQAERDSLEAALAREGLDSIDLPPECSTSLSNGLSHDVAACVVTTRAVPSGTGLSAMQVDAALSTVTAYFVALNALATTTAPAEIRANTAALLGAIAKLPGDSTGLEALRSRAQARGPLVSASAGFIAEQMRRAALRRVMQAADQPIEAVVAQSVKMFESLGDTIAADREAVRAAREAYEMAVETGNAEAQIAAVARLRQSITAMHAAEQTSAIRRLFLLRDLHGLMLARLNGAPNIDDLLALSAELAEIATLARSTQ